MGSMSVNDYFLRRRRDLGLAGVPCPEGPASASAGFTLDDQASFAEQQLAMSYSGRVGLGHGGGSNQDHAGYSMTNAGAKLSQSFVQAVPAGSTTASETREEAK